MRPAARAASVGAVLADLKLATDILQAVKTHNPAAWPLAEKLAEAEVMRAVKALVRERNRAPDFSPILSTEADLAEVFGRPTDADRRNRRGTTPVSAVAAKQNAA